MIRMTVKDGSIVQTLTLDCDKVFLGRLDSNTVRLSDPSVSRKHCLIRRVGRRELEVLDLNSRHGTRRNGESVDRAPLRVGDELSLGEVHIRIEALEGLTAAAQAAVRPPRREEKPPPADSPAREKKELLSDLHRTTFAEEFYGSLRRTPWWATSLLLHVLLIYFCFSVPFGPETGDSPFGSVNGELGDDFSSFLEKDLDLPSELEAVEPEEPEDLSIREEPETLPETETVEVPEVELPDLGPPVVALAEAFLRPSSGSALLVPNSGFGKDQAADANRAAMSLLKKSLGGRGTRSLALLRRFKKSELLVARGHYDHVQEILNLLTLPHEEVPMVRLGRTDLRGRKVLFINCSNETLAARTIERIREYVRRGGYLLTTDWAVEKVLEPAFEGYVRPLRKNGRNVITPDEVISIQAVPERSRHFLLKGTALVGHDAKWWLEESSFPFEVLNPAKVEVLITSKELMAEYGVETVALTFRYGEGRVFHMLGHFFQKEGNLRGTFSTQRMIANFLIAAVRRQ